MTEPNQPTQDKLALRSSQAGMRFIAQMTLYNSEKFDRLRQFIADSYSEAQLAAQPVETRLQELRETYEQAGRLRVRQVLAANEHHVIVAMEAEKADGLYYTEMKVTDDYPHKITAYMFQPLQPVE